ncbi:hypothetical protein ACFSTC_38885 [Nonomuraea ferruginea]
MLVGLPIEQVSLGARDQLCVPVAKNDVIPPDGVLDFVRYVDLSCYRVTGSSMDKSLVLSHLNRVLSDLPRKQVLLNRPEQLCVPVAKNGVLPPAEVLRVVRHIDLLCYGATPNVPMNRPLALRQLNPVLVGKIPLSRRTGGLLAPALRAGVQGRGQHPARGHGSRQMDRPGEVRHHGA